MGKATILEWLGVEMRPRSRIDLAGTDPPHGRHRHTPVLPAGAPAKVPP